MPYLERFSDIDQYFLFMCSVASWRATCRRRRVGCVLVDSKNHIRATGYNGVPRNQAHCLTSPCPGAGAEIGMDLNDCYATHAEINAFLQLGEYSAPLTLYCSTMPCRGCAKAIANADVARVVVGETYPDSVAYDILTWAGIKVEWIPLEWQEINQFVQESQNGSS